MAKILPFRRSPSMREELGVRAQRHSVSAHIEAARTRLAALGIDLPRDEPPPEPDTSMLDPYLKIQIENNARREALGYRTHPIIYPDKKP